MALPAARRTMILQPTRRGGLLYKKILVPVDGGETSLRGLRHAVLLANDLSASLRLIYVVHDYLVADGRHGLAKWSGLLNELREQGRSILDEAAGIARSQGIEAVTECVETPMGSVGAAITQYATEWPADLIVIGTHGRRGIRRLVMGSDAEYIVRTAPVPVLLVRGTTAAPQD
jgi:nucleotide-binding universal stress UspA family protein